MTINAAALNLIKGFESKELKAYRDAVGIWTIGYGHTAMAGPPSPKAGMTITSAEADALLLKDLGKYEAPVKKLVKVPLNENQYGALTSLVFNIGEGNFAKSTLLKKLNAGNYAAVPAELMKWNKAKGKVLAGLTRRRKAEGQLFTKPVSARPKPVPAPAKPAPVPVEPIVPKPAPTPAPASDKAIIANVQRRLKELGYNPGGDDGILGPLTKGSILSFRNDNGLKPSDEIDADLLKALATASPRKMVPERANASASEIATKVPEANAHWWNKYLAGGGAGTGALLAVGDAIAPAKGYVDQLRDDVPPWAWFLLFAIFCGGIAYMALRGQKSSDDAYRTGERR